MSHRHLSSSRAFTLIELLVVILIIGILIAVAAPSFLGQTDKATKSAQKQDLAVAYRAVKAWAVFNEPQGSFDGVTIANAITPSEGANFAARMDSVTGSGDDLTLTHVADGDIQCTLEVTNGGAPVYDCGGAVAAPTTPTPVPMFSSGLFSINEVNVSSDGTTLVWASGAAPGDPYRLWTLPVSGGTPTDLDPGGSDEYYEASIGSGLIVYSSDRDDQNGQLYKQTFGGDLSTGTQLTFSAIESGGANYPHISPDGSKVAYISSGGQPYALVIIDINGGFRQVISGASISANWGIDWSPNGSQIVFTSTNYELYTVPADGSAAPTQIGTATNVSGAAWSPDGSQIAYVSNVSFNQCDLGIMDANGNNQFVHYSNTESSCDFFGLDWAGSSLFYVSRASDSNTDTLYKIDAP